MTTKDKIDSILKNDNIAGASQAIADWIEKEFVRRDRLLDITEDREEFLLNNNCDNLVISGHKKPLIYVSDIMEKFCVDILTKRKVKAQKEREGE